MWQDGITIAIPSWHHEYLLPRSIGSALRAVNSLKNRQVPGEVLVVDDNSRDGSLMLLRQLEALYYDDGLHVLARTANGGPSAARNDALANARHRYIIFMDADNQIIPENVYHFYQSIRQTDAAAVYGNLIRRGINSEDISFLSNESFQDRMFEDNYIDVFALFDRSQLVDSRFLLAREMMGREDWEFYLHLACQGLRIVYVPIVFGIYYDLPSSLVKQAIRNDDIQRTRLSRMYNQLGLRQYMPMNTRHLRYHPAIGYI